MQQLIAWLEQAERSLANLDGKTVHREVVQARPGGSGSNVDAERLAQVERRRRLVREA